MRSVILFTLVTFMASALAVPAPPAPARLDTARVDSDRRAPPVPLALAQVGPAHATRQQERRAPPAPPASLQAPADA